MSSLLRSNKENWRRQVLSAGAAQYFEAGDAVNFPFKLLKEATSTFVASKRGLRQQTPECDSRLMELVTDYLSKGGSREVAILACVDTLTPTVATGLLMSLRDASPGPLGCLNYLKCLLLTGKTSPLLVSEAELRTAQALGLLLSPGQDRVTVFRDLISSLGQFNQSNFFPAAYINNMLDFVQFRQGVESTLEDLQKARAFKKLHDAVSWLRNVSSLKHTAVVAAVLSAQLPSWHLWASWRPNYLRLMAWEGGHLTPLQKQRLANILDLEGPDTTKSGCATLKDTAPGCFSKILVTRRDASVPRRLLDLLDKAQAVKGTGAVDLFIHVCVENAADEADMVLVQDILATQDDDCCRSVLWVLLALAPNTGINNRMVALTKGLPGLQRHAAIRDRFAAAVVEQVIRAVQEAQAEYCRQLQGRGMAENFGLKLHAFGKTILEATWIHPHLPAAFVQMLHDLPSDELMGRMFDHLRNSGGGDGSKSIDSSNGGSSSADTIKAYLAVTVGGKGGGTTAAALLEAVHSKLNLWGGAPPNSDRAGLARAIESMVACAGRELVRACQERSLMEEHVLVQDLVRILRMDANVLCNELARLLARRRELSCEVGPCWVGLLRCVMAEQARKPVSLVDWSTEMLAPREWFRWLRDLEVLFPAAGAVGVGGGDGRSRQDDGVDIGVTPELRAWWNALSGKYAPAVHKIESLQRGQGSLRWLYMRSIDDTVVLLDLLTQNEPLDKIPATILAHFEADVEIIFRICEILASLKDLSSLGRLSFESLLKRHKRTSTKPWRTSALQVLQMGWAARLTSHSDGYSLLNLGKLLGLVKEGAAAVDDDSGFNSALKCLMVEYHNLLQKASGLESVRLSLRVHNGPQTATLLTRLGIQDTGGYVDPTVPEALSDSIEAVGDGEYELAFPLTEMRAHQRQVVGLQKEATLLLVRVSLPGKGSPKFCVHFYPNEEGGPHTSWFANGNLPQKKVCTTTPTPFTYLLGRALARHLYPPTSQISGPSGPKTKTKAKGSSNNSSSLASIHALVSEILASPGSRCVVCSVPHPGVGSGSGSGTGPSSKAKIWRPTHCSPKCGVAFRSSPLEVRVAAFLSDPPLLDFLLCCLHAAATNTTALDLLPECPVPKASLAAVINSFPGLVAGIQPAALLARIRAPDALAGARELLLSWVCVSFGGCMLTAPAGAKVPLMPGVHQFLLANSPPAREQLFAAKQTASSPSPIPSPSPSPSSSSGGGGGVGGVVFHGTPANRVWKILTEGLKVMSNTPFMAHGASGGAGIYLADEPAQSMGYSGNLGAGWSGTQFAHRAVLLGCELQGHAPASYHVVADETRVLVRYVFVCPANFTAPQVRLIDSAMKATYASLRTGLF